MQVDIPEGSTLQDMERLLAQSGMQPPLLVKPLWTDGREGSHGLAVVYDLPSLGQLLDGSGAVSSSFRPPVVIQQFVPHGGALHKVYVLGSISVVCKRPSLGDQHLGDISGSRRKGVLQLPRISCKTVAFDLGGGHAGNPESLRAVEGGAECSNCSPPAADQVLDSETELLTPSSRPSSPDEHRPPEWFTRALAHELRARMGLQLFNFDLIVPEQQSSADEDLYLVVDINYFPGERGSDMTSLLA